MKSHISRRLRRALALMKIVSISWGFALSLGQFAQAADGKIPGGVSPTGLSPEALGAKALLEDLLARRYSQELGTIIDSKSFSIGAQLDLVAVPPPPSPLQTLDKPTESEPISDLLLGTLDPEALLRAYAGPIADRPATTKALDNFKIRSVAMSVGLHDDLSPDVKGEVEKWLNKRLSTEFGKSGKGVVSQIKLPVKKPVDTPIKTKWDWLEQFQSLAGQVVIALALLVGVILWQLLARPAESSFPSVGGDSASDSSDMAALQRMADEVKADNKKAEEAARKMDETERVAAISEIETTKIRLVELVPQMQGYLEEIVRNWCHMGDAGKLRIAVFAEVAGKEIGKLPIPVDALDEIQRVFQRMPEVSLRDKRDALQRAYWDLLSALNLGSDSLAQPFGYLDGLNVAMVNRVLIDQNPKLRTVVSLYMPDELRAKYMRSLSPERKRELLDEACRLSEIQADELETLNRSVMSKISPTRGQEVVPLERSLTKLVDALTIVEQVTMLGEMKGAVVEEYKRTVPSLAFLGQWPDEQLKMFLMGITPDELTSYLRVRPEQQERMLEFASMMVREIATDELAKPDKSSAADKEERLKFFTSRLTDACQQGDFNLEEIFGVQVAEVENTDEGDGTKQVA